MLSIVDIKKELGDNLWIYPIHTESIKGNSIDLHASRFGWSLKTRKPLADPAGEYLIIPPNDTALIYTEEALWVSRKLGGTYHSKVTLVSKGLGHIGTSLDPQYIGNSLMAIHNHAGESYRLRIGAEFVTLILYYLHTPTYQDTNVNDNSPGHSRMLDGLVGKDAYIEWRDQNKWVVQENLLYNKMVSAPEYALCKQEFKQEQIKFNRKLRKTKVFRYVITLAVILTVLALFCIPAYLLELGKASQMFQLLTEKILLPLLLAVLSAQVIVDVRSK